MRSRIFLLAIFLALATCRTTEEKEQAQKAIRMKTSRQLKEIFDELGISHKGLDKEQLKKVAYKEDAVARWEELHPEKKRNPNPKGGMPDYGPGGGDFGPGGKYEDMMRQMRGDFSAEKDPERRRILEKLQRKGMSFAGGSGQSTEELRKMEKMFDGLNFGKMGADGGGGIPKAGDDDLRDSSEMDSDVAEEDKMEL